MGFTHCNTILPQLLYVTPVTHRVCHANTHMALKLVHHLRHTSTQSCHTTHPPSIPPLWTQSSIRFSHPLFRMRCTAAAYSGRIFPFSLAPSEFIVPCVHVFAASQATFSIGWRSMRATTAGDLPVAATTTSLIPYIPHIQTRITPCNP